MHGRILGLKPGLTTDRIAPGCVERDVVRMIAVNGVYAPIEVTRARRAADIGLDQAGEVDDRPVAVVADRADLQGGDCRARRRRRRQPLAGGAVHLVQLRVGLVDKGLHRATGYEEERQDDGCAYRYRGLIRSASIIAHFPEYPRVQGMYAHTEQVDAGAEEWRVVPVVIPNAKDAVANNVQQCP